jgi:dynein heavy chain
MSPGLISLTWVSPKIDEYCDTVLKTLDIFDLMLKRANELVLYRIEAVLNDITNISLSEINDDEPSYIDDFLSKTESLCEIGAVNLQSKSQNIEDATEELIDLLYPDYKRIIDGKLNEDDDEFKDDDFRSNINLSKTQDIGQRTMSTSGKLQMPSAKLAAKKRREARLAMIEAAQELFNYFSHKNSDSIVKLVRSTLEKLRKRISTSQSTLTYGSDGEKDKKDKPVFKCNGVLAIPAITMQPTLDEVQQTLNKAVQNIINVSKSVTQWTKGKKTIQKKATDTNVIKESVNEQTTNNETSQQNDDNQNNSNDGQTNERPNSPTASVHIQKNYYKSVSENKDVIKIVSLLSTCISSTKKDVLTAVDRFKEYQFIWQNDRDEDLREFLKQDSLSVSEFETKIKSFEVYITEINSHPEYIPIGAIALVTEKLKMGLISEIQIWKNHYGLACNHKYKKEINEISLFIDDIFKKLNREITDLDDIRLTMNALKDLRENEIRIDMSILPIEESYTMLQKYNIDVPREEIDKCDTLRYNWQKLLQLSSQTSSLLLQLQPQYKDQLKNNVNSFSSECITYYSDYQRVENFFNMFFALKYL